MDSFQSSHYNLEDYVVFQLHSSNIFTRSFYDIVAIHLDPFIPFIRPYSPPIDTVVILNLAKQFTPFLNKLLKVLPGFITESPLLTRKSAYELLYILHLCVDCFEVIAPMLEGNYYATVHHRNTYISCLRRWELYEEALSESIISLASVNRISKEQISLKVDEKKEQVNANEYTIAKMGDNKLTQEKQKYKEKVDNAAGECENQIISKETLNVNTASSDVVVNAVESGLLEANTDGQSKADLEGEMSELSELEVPVSISVDTGPVSFAIEEENMLKENAGNENNASFLLLGENKLTSGEGNLSKQGNDNLSMQADVHGDVVMEFIEGLVETYPGWQYLDGFPQVKVVLRADVSGATYDKVAVISGGGSGHEPSHAGFVEGMLTSAICGDVFAFSPVDSILAGIRAVTGVSGCLLIVKNYTGDRLNFGVAAEQAKSVGYKVEMVIVGDDCALPPPRGIAGRGLAGTVLGYYRKIKETGLFPNEVTNRAVIKILCERNMVGKVEDVMNDLEKLETRMDENSLPVLVKMYVNEGLTERAKLLVEKIQSCYELSSRTRAAIIDVYVEKCLWVKAESLFYCKKDGCQEMDILECFYAPEELHDFYSSALNAKTTAIKTADLTTFPDYLVLHMRKFVLEAGWVLKKLDVYRDVPDTIDISHMRSKGHQPSEELLPYNAGSDDNAGINANEDIVMQLVSMGFQNLHCQKAAINTSNAGVEESMNWLLNHMNDSDIDEPIKKCEPYVYKFYLKVAQNRVWDAGGKFLANGTTYYLLSRLGKIETRSRNNIQSSCSLEDKTDFVGEVLS